MVISTTAISSKFLTSFKIGEGYSYEIKMNELEPQNFFEYQLTLRMN